MKQPKTISLIGHSGSGKSTLAREILRSAGVEEEVDFDPSAEEKSRGYSIDLGVGSCTYHDQRFNLLDTPGAGEFVEEVYKGVHVAENVVLLLDSTRGVQVQTEKVWGIARDEDKPSFALVNKMDNEEADFDKVVRDMEENLEGKFLPLQIPVFDGGQFVGIVDVLGEDFWGFEEGKGDVPEDLEDELAERREVLLEELAGQDDELMMKYLEEEEIQPEDIARALSKGVAEASFTPVLCSVAEEGLGVELLLRTLDRYGKSFTERDHISKGLVFNQFRDPYLGKLSFIKVYGGTIATDDSFVNLRTGEEDEIQDIYKYQGNQQEKLSQAGEGEIVALGKLEELDLGDTLSETSDGEPLEFVQFPSPVYDRAISPESSADEGKMSTALSALGTTKATIEFRRDEVTGELILSGMGDNHLSVFQERLKNDFNVSILMSEPQIPYKQTVSKNARAQYRHKKQSGGRGQFAEVYLEVAPLARGEGFQFENEIKGGVIPTQFIPGVEKGVLEALDEDYPITDIKATVYDGDHHPVDSSEMAFKIAGREACQRAIANAGPILLEPIMEISVTTPGDYTGDIMSDLSGRRGRVSGTESLSGETVIKAQVPRAEVQNYAMQLKSLTQGRATFQMEFLQYDKVPGNIAEQILEE